MAKDHGSSVKNDKQYEGLREKGMSKSRAAAISPTHPARRAGAVRVREAARASKASGSGSGGNTSQKKAAGRKGGKKSSSSS